MLAALSPRGARAAALPARRAHEARGPRARRARPASTSRASPTRRTSASSPAPAARRFLARHGGLRERPGDIVDRGGRVARPPRRPPRLHGRPAQGPGRRRRASRSTSLATDARANTVTVGPRDELATQHRARARRCACTAREPDAVRCATARRRCAAAWTATRSTSTSPSTAPRRGRPRSSCAGTRSSDAPQSPDAMGMTTDEIRETFLRYFEAPRPPAAALGVARAVRRTTPPCC